MARRDDTDTIAMAAGVYAAALDAARRSGSGWRAAGRRAGSRYGGTAVPERAERAGRPVRSTTTAVVVLTGVAAVTLALALRRMVGRAWAAADHAYRTGATPTP